MPRREASSGHRPSLAILWTPLSAVFHAAVAYSLVASVTCSPDPIGSQEIELELLAPRLAPPLRVNGTARDLARGKDEKRGGARSSALERAERAVRRAEDRRRRSSAPALSARGVRSSALERAERAVRRAEDRRRRRAPDDDLLRSMAAVDPDGTIPFHAAKAVEQERAKRSALRTERLAASRASEARVAATLARMNASARAAHAGGGPGGAGGGRGALPRIGLRFYLSGRRVASSRVVRPPEPLRLPRKVCTLRRVGLSPTTVRMLVSKDGDVTVAYIKRRSGDRRFDRCARDMARKMRFHPGEDLAGQPLNVWIHLIVEPRVRSRTVAEAPLGG